MNNACIASNISVSSMQMYCFLLHCIAFLLCYIHVIYADHKSVNHFQTVNLREKPVGTDKQFARSRNIGEIVNEMYPNEIFVALS